MNIVEPIRDSEKIKEIYDCLKNKSNRNALMFIFGIYTGLRISDILKFKVKDCLGKGYNIREQKTGKQKSYDWNPYLLKELKQYCENKDPNEFIFKSRKGKNQAISRQTAYEIIKKACNECGVYNVGTHTLRKTFGYFLYMQSKNNIAMLMEILNHTSETITLRYLGITQEKSNFAMKKMRYF